MKKKWPQWVVGSSLLVAFAAYSFYSNAPQAIDLDEVMSLDYMKQK